MTEITVALISSFTTFLIFFLRNNFLRKKELSSSKTFWDFIKNQEIKELKIELKTKRSKEMMKSEASTSKEVNIAGSYLQISIPDRSLIEMKPEERQSIKSFLDKMEGGFDG